jgi:hypothetical protein
MAGSVLGLSVWCPGGGGVKPDVERRVADARRFARDRSRRTRCCARGRHRDGRFTFEGFAYAPNGEVRRESGGPIDGLLRVEFKRALVAAEGANDATMQESKWVGGRCRATRPSLPQRAPARQGSCRVPARP